jgi:hypothetical protein
MNKKFSLLASEMEHKFIFNFLFNEPSNYNGLMAD